MFLLSKESIEFPSPELANSRGILAVGGDLSPQRLLLAYNMGIFPWYERGSQIMWWSLDPRFVLFPNELKVSKSMRPYFNQNKFELTCDKAFEEVIRACQTQRGFLRSDTWITEDMEEAYCRLHTLGFAHSVEVWQGGKLVGGLYGVSLGKCFFGESMFSKVSNASKFGFIALTRRLEELGFGLIDCQQETNHLASLGARSIPRREFLAILKKNEQEETLQGKWTQLFSGFRVIF